MNSQRDYRWCTAEVWPAWKRAGISFERMESERESEMTKSEGSSNSTAVGEGCWGGGHCRLACQYEEVRDSGTKWHGHTGVKRKRERGREVKRDPSCFLRSSIPLYVCVRFTFPRLHSLVQRKIPIRYIPSFQLGRWTTRLLYREGIHKKKDKKNEKVKRVSR